MAIKVIIIINILFLVMDARRLYLYVLALKLLNISMNINNPKKAVYKQVLLISLLNSVEINGLFKKSMHIKQEYKPVNII